MSGPEVLMADGALKRQGDSVTPQGIVFRARRTADTVIGSAWNGPIGFDQKTFDPYSFYDGSARFQPKVPGYYRVSATCAFSGAPVNTYTPADIALAKNGTLATIGNIGVVTAAASLGFRSDGWLSATVSDLIYLNGSTDYVEVYAYMGTTGISIRGTSGDQTSFSAELVGSTVGYIPPPPIWAAPKAFYSGWRIYNGAVSNWTAAQPFRKDPTTGVVMLTGLYDKAGGNWAASESVLQLPDGWWPLHDQIVIVPCNNSQVEVRISSTTGILQIGDYGGLTNPVGWLSLSGIVYPTT